MPTKPDDEILLRRAIAVAASARAHGNHPFGAILVDPDGAILLEAENTVVTERDATGHAERNLMSTASQRFEPALLARCTMYTSTEPARCAPAASTGSASAASSTVSPSATFWR